MASTSEHEVLANVCREYGLDLLILFGSHAAGRARRDSDVDLGFVRSSGVLDSAALSRLASAVEPHLPPGDLDMVDLGRSSGLLRHVAAERGRVLHEARPGLHTRFRVASWLKYQDERIQLRRHDHRGIVAGLRALGP